MRLLFTFLIVCIGMAVTSAQAPFITTWETDNPGNSCNSCIRIPSTDGSTYNYDVDWNNDGVYDEVGVTGSTWHDFGLPGTYTIAIRGDFPRIFFNNEGDKDKIISVDQWGDIQWTSMELSFMGCTNLNIIATDSPDLSNVTNMMAMFSDAKSFNAEIGDWDVSNVTNMRLMYNGASDFNQDLSDWDVSNVTDMRQMFSRASNFNQDLSDWDVSNVTNMEWMFTATTNFNQDLSDWDVSNVTSMRQMLDNSGLSCMNYSSTLKGWADNPQTANNISLGANGLIYESDAIDARESLINDKGWTIVGDMEGSCPSAQAPFITTWKTSNPGNSCNSCITIPTVGGSAYNYEVDWDNDGVYDETGITGSVTHDFGVPGTYTIAIRGDSSRISFRSSGDKNKIISVDQWGDIQWTNMLMAFRDCENINIMASDNPNLSDVTVMTYMFSGASNFNGDIGGWDVSNVTDMEAMFDGASNFNGDISEWDVSNVTNMKEMFDGAANFNGDISGWDVSNVTDMSYMFSGASSFNTDISGWDVNNVTDMREMFARATNFNGDMSGWDVSNVTDMSGMFWEASNFNGDIGGWDVSNVTNMSYMFWEASNFNGDISGWDVSNNVSNMGSMFRRASNFNTDISGWDVSYVNSMGGMFSEASSFNQDLGSWNLLNFRTLGDIFKGSGLSCENYSRTLIGWAENPQTANNLDLEAEGMIYGNDAIDARQSLINDKGWTIEGDTQGSCTVSSETVDNPNIRFYPNPASERIYIDTHNLVKYSILDSYGRILEQGITHGRIEVSHLPPAMYILQLTDKQGETVALEKWIKQ